MSLLQEKEKEKPSIDFELKDVCDDDTNVDSYSIINANVSQDILSVHSSFWLREALDYRDYWDNQDDQDYSIFQQYLDYQVWFTVAFQQRVVAAKVESCKYLLISYLELLDGGIENIYICSRQCTCWPVARSAGDCTISTSAVQPKRKLKPVIAKVSNLSQPNDELSCSLSQIVL